MQLCLSKNIFSLGFSLTDAEVQEALSTTFNIFEEQGCNYFSGYLIRKILRYHTEAECSSCSGHGTLLTSSTTEVTDKAFYTWLKRYDDDCKLYAPSPVFFKFVNDMSCIVLYCFEKFLTRPQVLRTISELVRKNVAMPAFCSSKMQEKAVSLGVRTLFLYKLKWLNDTRKSQEKKSERKKRILLHQ